MKKKILILILILLQFYVIKVSGESKDYLPLNNNYFDPGNFVISGELYDWQLSSIEPIRIKEDSVYSLYSRNYTDYFLYDLNIVFFNHEGEEIDYLPKYRNTKYSGYGTYEISFTSPLGANHLALDFRVQIMSQPLQDYYDLLGIFVLYEGANAKSFSDYLGLNEDYLLVSKNQNAHITTNINQPLMVESIRASLKAEDYIDGDLSQGIEIIEDNYTINSNRLGTYDLIFGVSDNSGNQSLFKTVITIIDNTPPVITGNNHLITSPEEFLTENEIKTFLSVSDNYDQEVELIIIEDEYSSNYHTLGSYELIFGAVDSSGNQSSYAVIIEVTDLIGPVISGPEVIQKSYQETMLAEDILTLYSAYDAIDGEVSNSLKIEIDNYSENMYRLGSWRMVISSEDRSKNKSSQEVFINVVDKKGPIFYINKGVIDIQLINQEVDLETMLYTLQERNELPSGDVLNILEDEYSDNKKTPGNYRVLLASDDEMYELIFSVETKIPLDELKERNLIKNAWQEFTEFIRNLFR